MESSNNQRKSPPDNFLSNEIPCSGNPYSQRAIGQTCFIRTPKQSCILQRILGAFLKLLVNVYRKTKHTQLIEQGEVKLPT